jgi:hypothetical protein
MRRSRTLVHLWICLSAAYVALLPQFYLIFDSANRYTLLWSRAYHLAIFSSIALLAILFFVARTGLQHLAARFDHESRADAIAMLWLFFIGFRTISSLLIRLETLPSPVASLLWSPWTKLVLYVLVPAPFLLLHPEKTKRVLKRLYIALSILPMFFIFQSTRWTTFEKYDASIDEASAATKTESGRNFLIFVMDEWSFDRTFGEAGWEENFPALATLLEESTLYTQAYSLGGETRVAIPRLFFSNDDAFMRKTFREVFDFNESGKPYFGNSLVDLVPERWLRIAAGFTINYPVLLEGKTDLALRFESENVRRTFRGEFRHLMLSQFSFLRIVGIRFDYVIDPDWYPQMEVHEFAMDVLRGHRADLFGFFHYGWPHYPYIWNRQGRKPGKISAAAARDHTVENYVDNLAYLDVVVDEICGALRESGRWDDSLVVFTSDHTWRFDPAKPHSWSDIEDPDPTAAWKHVPMIVKYPGRQAGRIESEAIVSHGGLHRLLDAYVQGRDLQDGTELLRLNSDFP